MNSADFYQQKDIAEMDISGTFEAMSQTTLLPSVLLNFWSLTLGKPAAMSSEHSQAGPMRKYTWQDTGPPANESQCECAILEADAAASGLQMTSATVNILIATP